jgi:hypothetical protein
VTHKNDDPVETFLDRTGLGGLGAIFVFGVVGALESLLTRKPQPARPDSNMPHGHRGAQGRQ